MYNYIFYETYTCSIEVLLYNNSIVYGIIDNYHYKLCTIFILFN